MRMRTGIRLGMKMEISSGMDIGIAGQIGMATGMGMGIRIKRAMVRGMGMTSLLGWEWEWM